MNTKFNYQSMLRRICNGMLLASTVVAALALVASLYRIVGFGWQAEMAVHIIVVIPLLIATALRASIPLQHRAVAILLIVFAAAIATVWEFGMVSEEISHLFFLPIISALFFSLRLSIVLFLVVCCTAFAIMVVTISGGHMTPVILEQYVTSPSGWALWILGTSIYFSLIFIAFNLLIRSEAEVVEPLSRNISDQEASTTRFDFAMRGTNEGLWDWDIRTGDIYYSPRWFGMLGYAPGELPNETKTWAKLVDIRDRDRVLKIVDNFVFGIHNEFETEYCMRHKNGSRIDILARGFLVRENGKGIRLVGTNVDVTTKKRDEARLRQSELNFRQFVEGSIQGIAVTDVKRKVIFANDEFIRMFGYNSAEEIYALGNTSAFIAEYEQDRIFAIRLEASEGRGQSRIIEFDGVRKDGRVINLECLFGQAQWDGQPAVLTSFRDVTKRRETEKKLIGAQKREAVGQLTGGVAHDFNNLLAVIQGNAEMMQELGGEGASFAKAILNASGRGAELTQRLLAFSRQQPLNPETIDIGDLVSCISELIRRVLGETFEVETISAVQIWPVHIDSSQVENALLNLAINARNAMPLGGKLTIEVVNITLDDECANKIGDISAGDYVVLSVSDQGKGMSEESQSRAFEPFFTTKGVGQGSGLGLSMVYGFAQQSGGQATINSELGKGTTVKLYLPRGYSKVKLKEKPQIEPFSRGNGETVLVIEDELQVRELAEVMLKNLNYGVVSVENVNAARQTLKANPEIDLVLSDVILPGGTSGPEFADELKETHPNLATIFMSGYPADSANRTGFRGADITLLNKPFKINDLAKALKAKLS